LDGSIRLDEIFARQDGRQGSRSSGRTSPCKSAGGEQSRSGVTVFGIKLVLLLALLAIGLLCGALPLRGRGFAPRVLEWGNACAAGIFLGAGFVHMLPDATAMWQQLGWHYPIGQLLAAAAIVFMLLFEHVLPPEDAHHAVHAPSAHRFGGHDSQMGPA